MSQFQKYNTVLRRNTKDDKDGMNLYSTTIHVLASAVQKVATVMKLESGLKLYRGLGGMELPEFFYHADGDGFRGIMEYAFMSTTASKAVALEYSGIKKDAPHPSVLEITVSAVDCGAW